MPVAEILDFSSSLNDFIDIDISDICETEFVSNYPEEFGDDVVRKISDYCGLSIDQILLGPGLSYFIFRLAEQLRNSRVLLLEPSFSEFERAFSVNGCRIKKGSIDNPNAAAEEIVKREYEVVILARPDSPRGDLIPDQSLYEIAQACGRAGATLFVDEAFFDFLDQAAKEMSRKLVAEFENVILGRSLTKIFPIPSLRIGYLVSAGEMNRLLKERMEPWPIGQMSLEFLKHADFERIREYVEKNRIEKEYLIREMNAIGFELVGRPVANYATFKIPNDVDPLMLVKFLNSRNILVRTLEDYDMFGINYMRVSVKRRIRMNSLLGSLGHFMSVSSFHKHREL